MPARYALNPGMPVLLRPDDTVQVGWDPRRAVLIHPPAGLSAAALAAVLRSMHSPADSTQWQLLAAQHGLRDAAEVSGLLAALVKAGVLKPERRRARSASVRVHGRGPLSDLLVEGLRCSGARIKHTSQPNAVVTPGADLVVLSDYLIAEPRLVRELHDERVAHLAVRMRDGNGLVGPLVIPGVTSCLTCADLHRSDRDEAWPAVAAQLRDTVAHADRATVLATAALALHQVTRVIQAVHGMADPTPPTALGATLEFDVGAGSITTRRWRRHPRCRC